MLVDIPAEQQSIILYMTFTFSRFRPAYRKQNGNRFPSLADQFARKLKNRTKEKEMAVRLFTDINQMGGLRRPDDQRLRST
jgi:hypothetical protein